MKRPSASRTLPNFVASTTRIAPALQGAANQFLVVAATVNVSGIKEIDAEVEGAVYGRYRLLFLLGTIEFRHAHASQPEGRDLQGAVAKVAVPHWCLLLTCVNDL